MTHNDDRSAWVQRVLNRVRALQRSRAARDASHQFWIEGVRQFVQAVDAGLRFETVVISRVLLQSDIADMLARRLCAERVPRARVTPEQFRSINIANRASGVGAIVRQHYSPLRSLDPQAGLCWLVIDRLRSPGNLGTILRTAEAVGAGGVIFLTNACDPFDPATVRASMGGTFHLQLAVCSPSQYRQWARDHGVTTVGLAPRVKQLWTSLPAARPIAIVLGEERRGMTAETTAVCDVTVQLPMSGRADSLNVAMAAGVMLYELVRRQHAG
jgi:TrmH family RNA methyltransferase